MSGAAVHPIPSNRWLGAGLSVAGHLVVLAALFFTARSGPSPSPPPVPVVVELVADPRPPPAPEVAVDLPLPAAAETPPPRGVVTPIHARRVFAATATDALPAAGAPDGVSESELSGAAVAGSGSPGRGCDMARRVQGALRRDPLVRAAVADAAGRAIRVWDGDWVQSQGEDGKGLAAVREAILWEIAFTPAPCRTEPVRGLVLLSPSDAPGAARLVVGAGAWRWSDLLKARGPAAGG